MACIVPSAVAKPFVLISVCSLSNRMIVRPGRHATTPDQEPQAEEELTDERDRGDFERRLAEHRAGAVERIPEARDDHEDPQEGRDVAGLVREVSDDHEMCR